MDESKCIMQELCFLDRGLTYAKERTFKYKHAGSVSLVQDISDVGGTVWDASIVLSHYIDSLGEVSLQGKTLVELGAGTALPSIVAARLGMSVVVTDLPNVLQYTENAIARNCKAQKDSNQIQIQSLSWGAQSTDLDILLDSKQFDFVIGADIVYNQEYFKELQETLIALCPDESTQVLICFEQRRRDLTAFWDSFEPHFNVKLVTSPLLDMCRADANVYLYQMTRKPL